MSAPPPLDRASRSSSAFQRFANIVPSLSGSSTSSGSYASQGSAASLPPAPTPPPARALDALEALASADQSSRRNPSADGRQGDKSRSRERTGGDPSLAYIVQSRMVGAANAASSSGAYWGGESLPPNASGSTFSMFAPGSSGFTGQGGENGSHFFGTSAFSFEGGDGSWRSSASPSLFSGGQSRFTLPEQSSIPENHSGFAPSGSLAASWEPSSANSARARGESPMGGGRKMKEASRALRFYINGAARDRGMVGLAKPPSDGEQGRVVVAGKTCLKVLKVPQGGPRRGRVDTPASTGSKSSSSIAYRRSRSRGIALSQGEDDDSASEKRQEREEVVETLDVRSGAKLGPAYLFSDVRWGYGATSNRLATSFTNGAVALWDLGNGATAKISHQIKYEHDRAVNRVVFGGQSGSWLMSGGQDGQMKLWDIRENRPASLVLKASSPVRHLAFSPSTAQPFTLVAACGSGTLIRYDIRYTGRQGGGAIDRIAGHVGSCLAMDWRDNHEGERADTAGGAREGGWVVTAGLDKTIKIWDFSLATLSTKPVRTLHASQPVQTVAWHPTRATEVISSPLPMLADGGVDDAPSTAASTEPTSATKDVGNSWKNEIEIWDTRRPFFPKLAIKTDEPTSALTFNDDDTIWSVAKSSATFLQHDINSDSYALLDSIERPGAPWNLEGEMVFVEDPRHKARGSPFRTPSPSRTPERGGVDAPFYRPEVLLNSVTDIDPDFHRGAFDYLANTLQVAGKSFADICQTNAEAYSYAERHDASQLWETLRIWLDDNQPFLPESPPPTPSPPEPKAPPAGAVASTTPSRLDDWLLSPSPSTPTSDSRSSNTASRLSFSNSLALRVGANHSPRLLPTESKIPLDDFSEESTASENDPSPPLESGYSYYPELSSASSDSDHHQIQPRLRKLSSGANSGPNKLIRSFSAINPPTDRRSRSTTVAGEPPSLDAGADETLLDSQPSRRPSSTPRISSRRPSFSSGSDSGDEAPSKHHRVRTAKIQALQSALTKRRLSASDQRRPAMSRDSAQIKSSRRPSNDPPSLSRRGSAPGAAFGRSERAERVKTKESGPFSKDLHRAASLAYTHDATAIFKKQIRITLQEYADLGDHQLVATVCCVLRDKDMGFPSLFVARVTTAYLDLLRQLQLYTAAAALNKYCSTESLRALTQNTVVFHTACGECGKALDQPPFGLCSRCKSQVTRCCICHLVARSLYLCCATCGHGAHPECLAQFATSLVPRSARHSHNPSPHDASHPSTPGIGTPLRAWLWGEDGEDGEGFEVMEAEELRKERAQVLASCPSGVCGHSPCLLQMV